MAEWGDVLARAVGAAADRVRIRVKTNYGPAVVVYDGARHERSLLMALLGLRVGFTVENLDGHTLAEYGPLPATEPIRAAVVVLLLAILAGVIVRGLWRR